VLWLDLIGAWLLVLGPMYQGAIELRALQAGTEKFKQLGRPPRVSHWWWLVPPIHFALQRREEHRFFVEARAKLTRDDLESLVRFIEKAAGWWVVTLGALLIAVSLMIRMVGLLWALVGSPLIVAAFVALVAYRIRTAAEVITSQPLQADARTAAPDVR
jgi:hypothetical protein